MANHNLKAVILAAGNKQIDGKLLLLQTLGAKTIIDYVVENALRLVSAKNLYIVVNDEGDTIQQHLGKKYNYVVQAEQLGTGHAVLQVQEQIKGYDGDLLILYGDTALFRPATVSGMVNRHQLRDAKMTLLTAQITQDLPYGRIVRDADDQIMDIIEAADASPKVKDIREINVGAYMAEAPIIFDTLNKLNATGQYRLTDCAHSLIRSGAQVENHQLYDVDEALGINSAADLEQAEFILQKRFYRPKRGEEQNLVTFGTGGWRAIIGEGFTMYNVRRLTQALANEIIRRGKESKGVVIGYDRRFLADKAAEAAAEVFAGNNIRTILLTEDAPTPLINYATEIDDCAYGLAFTASHNPPEWNGLKVFHSDGSLLLSNETKQLSDETNELTLGNIVKLPLDIALDSGIVVYKDFTNEYVDAVEALIDLQVIREAGLRVIVDPMYGVGQLTLGIILNEARCRVTFIHNQRNPLFGGRSPAPDQKALQQLMTRIREDSRYDLGLATDGDADRIAIVDERGEYVSVNDVLLLLYWYMHEVRHERGGVVRNLATTHLLDRLANHFGEKAIEAPVGFKHIAAAMVEHDLLLGGESSGGLTVRGHILGKDGIFASALIVEMIAKTGKTISQLQEHVWKITGRLYGGEANIPATSAMRAVVPKRLQTALDENASPYPIVRISDMDGTKLFFENDNWALLRFSGTEPVLRIFAEADTQEKADEG